VAQRWRCGYSGRLESPHHTFAGKDMNDESRLISKIAELLDGAPPAVARRVIDYFATTYRADLAKREQPRPAPAKGNGHAPPKPSFMSTEHRMEMGEIMLALARKDGSKGR
jgi:hypothetical protein